ncbi:MAG: sugar phosphate isomerase/epimerase family protein [Planctomycetota bacterium]
MDRRDFVKRSVAAVGGGMLLGGNLRGQAGAAMQSAKPARRAIRKAVKIGMIDHPGSLTEKFQLLRELGFDGVELDAPSGLDLADALRARDAAGIQIHGVVCSVHWRDTLSDASAEVRAKGRAGLETAIRDAARLGGSTVLLVPAVVSKNVSYHEAYERSQAEIRKVLPLAAELKIQIAFENVWNNFLLSPLEAARYVDEFQSPQVGWYFDVGNVVHYGWPEQWIRILGKRIIKLDIKEYSRKKCNDEGLWKGFDCELLEGDCDWPAVMRALDEIGFAGWATAEIPGGGRERLREIATRMDRIITS